MLCYGDSISQGYDAVFPSLSYTNQLARHFDAYSVNQCIGGERFVPELLAKLPLKVFGTSSIDALVHAVESSLSPKATVYTKLMGYKAIEMIITGYQKLVLTF